MAAESLECRQADLELCNDLALAGFRGPGWDRYAWELARYGYAVMMAWLRSGEMFSQCKAKGCNLGSPPLEWTIDDRAGLANETVALAVNSFKQALIEGKWTHDRGATLKTYFIGRVVHVGKTASRDREIAGHAVMVAGRVVPQGEAR